MSWLLGGLLGLSGLLLLGVVAWTLRFRRRRREAAQLRLRFPSADDCAPHRYEDLPDAGTWARIGLGTLPPVHDRSWSLADQPAPWRSTMANLGTRLRDHAVSDITLVHGTFVGTDPLSLLRALDGVPGARFGLQKRLGPLLKSATEKVLDDASNFPAPYPALLQSATGIPTAAFDWSSENGHVGRLQAAVGLARDLAARLEHRPAGARTLLVGHSHAGQVFAVLLQLIDGVAHAPQLVATAREAGEDGAQLQRDLAVLRRRPLDLVTLGTPVRYGWPARAGARLLHLINHRGAEPVAGALSGLLTTRDGDYVQQLGVAGSDIPSAEPKRRALEAELDGALGPGWAPKAWLEAVRHRRRVPDGGFTWLVDYGDAAPNGRPNFHLTGLGHAAYTRRATMTFWLERAADRFYT